MNAKNKKQLTFVGAIIGAVVVVAAIARAMAGSKNSNGKVSFADAAKAEFQALIQFK